MVGENAKMKTGQFQGLVKMKSLMFDKKVFVVAHFKRNSEEMLSISFW